MTKEEIGKILKQLRLDCKKTQKEVAEYLGKSQQLIGHWETGYSQPDANTLFVLCGFYGTTVDKAFGFESKDDITRYEMALIEKFRKLDNHSKELVSMVIEKELQRVSVPYDYYDENINHNVVRVAEETFEYNVKTSSEKDRVEEAYNEIKSEYDKAL